MEAFVEVEETTAPWPRTLEDIEEEEESQRSSHGRAGRDSHPLSILSREAVDLCDASTSEAGGEVGVEGATADEEDALERAMAASASSMRSHDILLRAVSPEGIQQPDYHLPSLNYQAPPNWFREGGEEG